MRFSEKVYEALVNLRGNPHFDRFLNEGLREYSRHETQRCISADGPTQSRAAGAVQALETLNTLVNDAPKHFERIKSNTPQGT